VSEEKQRLAYEELLIAEGSDWNWWYGPEHSSANDRDFDELYRSHLSNVYRLLGANPPDYLQQAISSELLGKARTVPQTAYIRPRINTTNIGYFDWLGAASFTADRRSSAMHGKEFLLERAYAGIDEQDFFLRLDFASDLSGDYVLEVRIEVLPSSIERSRKASIARFLLSSRRLVEGKLLLPSPADDDGGGFFHGKKIEASFERLLRARVPLPALGAQEGDTLLLRATLFREQLPIDSLPSQGWMEIPVIAEDQMLEAGDQVW
jgi:hypothetical protein